MDEFPTAFTAKEQAIIALEKLSTKQAQDYIEEIHRFILRQVAIGCFTFDWQVPINLSNTALTKIDNFLNGKKYKTKIVSRNTFDEGGETYTACFLIIEWKGE